MESAHKIVINHSSLYRECLKNHAAMLGAHATDGCGEFIASPSTVPSDPTSLTCAACGCHRNFHRRVASETPSSSPSNHADYEQETECIDKHMRKKHRYRDPHDDEAAGSHVLLTLKTGGGGGGGLGHGAAAVAEAGARKGKKRFRSKFSREQKEGMMALAERLRWRLQRRDEDIVEDGCRAVGVERSVFKVWMHNNKQAVIEMKRREQQQQQPQLQQQQQQNNNNNGVNDRMNGEENKVMNCSSSPPSDRS